jgi:regulator of sirC expression with transglutaminase-like and TPR domain
MRTSQEILEQELSQGESIDMARAALALAVDDYRGLDLELFSRTLDTLAGRVRARSGDSASLVDRLLALRAVLSDEEHYRGNLESYDDPRNSFFNEVMQRKLGIPITLSLVYTETARRAGIPLFGVAFPAHFCAAARAPHGAIVVDPFDNGRLLDAQGCRELFARTVPDVEFSAEMIRPAAPRAVLYRMLNNLKHIYMERNDSAQALRILNLMLAVTPDHPAELRARAAILTSLGHFQAALIDLNRCLALFPGAPDFRSLELAASALRGKVSYLN